MADSFTHATHKLSEASRAAITGLQNMDIPPAYTANDADANSDSDDGSDWRGPPVTVHIDASITVEGTGNQIALPPHPSSRPLRVVGENVRAAQGVASDYIGGPNINPQWLAADRAEQITDAVMQALKDSGVFAGTVTPMRQLDVHVDASVNVKGERNVLTTNVPVRREVIGVSGTPGDSPSAFRPGGTQIAEESAAASNQLIRGSLLETGTRNPNPNPAQGSEGKTPTETEAPCAVPFEVPEGQNSMEGTHNTEAARSPVLRKRGKGQDTETQITSNENLGVNPGVDPVTGAGGRAEEEPKAATPISAQSTKRNRTPSDSPNPEGGENEDEKGTERAKRVRT